VTMKPMHTETGAKKRVVACGGDSPLEIPASAPLLDGERSTSQRRELRYASLRRRALTRCAYFVKCVAKSTIVSNFHTWSFCVEMLQGVKQLASL
jgi:hypothetical protein